MSVFLMYEVLHKKNYCISPESSILGVIDVVDFVDSVDIVDVVQVVLVEGGVVDLIEFVFITFKN